MRSGGGRVSSVIRDLTDDEARAASPLKWGMTEPGVIPAWVAEMDYAVAEPIVTAIRDAIERGELGYPRFDLGGGELGEAYAGFAGRHLGHEVDPRQVLATVDVTAGVRLALDVLSEDKAPMVLPLPAYSPQLGLAEVTNRPQWDLPVTPDGDEYVLDLDHLDRLFADGAGTLLLTNPHNPCSHVHTRAELEGIRDLALSHGARVISDEIHAPLVLPGAEHIPYLALEGTADHAVAVVAASKAFNTAGLKCAQVVTGDRATLERLASVPMARNDSWSSLGVVAAVAAYRHGDEWLAALVERLAELRAPARRPPRRAPAARRGCARSRRRTSRGWTCAPTATTTRRPSRPRAASGSRPATTTTRGCPGTCGSTSRPHPSG